MYLNHLQYIASPTSWRKLQPPETPSISDFQIQSGENHQDGRNHVAEKSVYAYGIILIVVAAKVSIRIHGCLPVYER